jgi:hypothetical protein
MGGNATGGAVAGGDLYEDRSLGKGGTGGTASSSAASGTVDTGELDRRLRLSLPVLFRLDLVEDGRAEARETDVTLVAADVESRELGVPV